MSEENDGFIDAILRRWAGYAQALGILFTLGWGIQATWKLPSVIATYLNVKTKAKVNPQEIQHWEWRLWSLSMGIYAYWIFILCFCSDTFNDYWPTITGMLFRMKYGEHEWGLSIWGDTALFCFLAWAARKAADHYGVYELDGSFRKADCYQLEDELADIEKERAEVNVNDVDYAKKMAELDQQAKQMRYLYGE